MPMMWPGEVCEGLASETASRLPDEGRRLGFGVYTRLTRGWTVVARQKLVLTYQDYLKMPDDRTRKEIIGGELFVTAAPSPLHQGVVLGLASALRSVVRAHGLGEILVSPIDVVLSQTDVVQPDIIFVAAVNRQIIGDAAIHGAPDLVVEVLSPSTLRLDRQHKLDLYARAGIPEYWIVDTDSRVVEVYQLAEGAYRLDRRFAEGELYQSALTPELWVNFQDIWTPPR